MALTGGLSVDELAKMLDADGLDETAAEMEDELIEDGAEDDTEEEQPEGEGDSDDASEEEGSEEEPEEDEEDERIKIAKRDAIRNAKRQLRTDIRKALAGDQKARDALSGSDRALLTVFEEQLERRSREATEAAQAQARDRQVEESLTLNDQWVDRFINDRAGFVEAMNASPGLKAWWNEFAAYKEREGLPIYARSGEIRQKMEAAKPKTDQTATQRGATGTAMDPETLYVDLQSSADRRYLTEDDWDRLSPDNFTDKNDQPLPDASFQMAKLFGELVALRKRKTSQTPKELRRAAESKGRVIPRSAGSTPRRASRDDVIDRFVSQRERGVRDEKSSADVRKFLNDKYNLGV